jgi:porin
LVGTAFTDVKTFLTNLYWNQKFGGRGTLNAGWVDATDYLDVWAGASPWTGFMNFAFSTGSATIPAPNQGLGLAGGTMLGENIFIIAGLADSNADPSRPGDGFESFFDQREYFYHAEVGWTSSQDRIYLDNVHVTFWYGDERVEAMTPSGWGLNFSASWMSGAFIPFLRGGYAEDGGTFLQKSVSVGTLINSANGGHMAGVGFNWGEVNETTFGSDLRNQTTIEVFYRLQATERLALTPDAQLIFNPALNPDVDSIFVFGLRGRLAL